MDLAEFADGAAQPAAPGLAGRQDDFDRPSQAFMFLFHALEDAHALGGGVDIAAQTAVFVFSFFQALAFS
mgnify:CR=1 FL=1